MRLGEKLEREKELEREKTVGQSEAGRARVGSASGFARGLRLSSEMVAGVLVGAAIGWALDRVLGISPWGLIVFLLLGFVAGVVNVVRGAGVVPQDDTTPTDRT
jgi:ATP synthase protein I